MIACPNCKGVGAINGPKYLPPIIQSWKRCPTCKGVGKVKDRLRGWVICPQCGGWAKEAHRIVIGRACPRCKGVGIVAPSRIRS